MVTSELFFSRLVDLFHKKRIISIAGKSATGKTTLALQLVSKLLTSCRSDKVSCLWIQASELFPKKRLIKMYENSPDLLSYILKHIFITPSNCVLMTYSEQEKLIKKITDNSFIYPSNLRYVVIDNITHHFRYELSQKIGVQKAVLAIDDFFNRQIFPLVMFCERKDICIILIHEVSFNPPLGEDKMSFFKVYERIKALNVFLNTSPISNKGTIIIKSKKAPLTHNYYISNSGIELV